MSENSVKEDQSQFNENTDNSAMKSRNDMSSSNTQLEKTSSGYSNNIAPVKKHLTFLGCRGKKLSRLIGFIAGIGFLLFGYDQGVMGGLLTLKNFREQFPEMDDSSGQDQSRKAGVQGIAVAIYEIGCLIGAIACMYVGDRLGRRRTIFLGGIVMIIGAIIQTSAFSLAQFIVARVITGIGNGFNTATVPMWQSECSHFNHRGKHVMMEGMLVAAGIAVSYWIDFAFYFLHHSSASWRVPIAFQLVFAIILIGFVLFLPESPRWLMRCGREQEALSVTAAIKGLDEDHIEVLREVAEIKQQAQNAGEGSSLKKIVTNGKERHFHRTVLSFGIQMFQQITGINLITYYAAKVYEQSLGLGARNSRILAACNGTEYFLAAFIGIYYIDRIGRRKLLLISTIGMSATMAILAGTTSPAAPTERARSALEGLGLIADVPYTEAAKKGQIAAAVFLFVFNTFFAIGMLGIPWLYPAEITGLEIRASANGISTASNWIFNFMVVMITPPAFKNIQYKTYIIFAVINFVMIFFIYFFYPETANRSLEEMDEVFAKSSDGIKGWFDVVKVADTLPLRHKQNQHDNVEANEPSDSKES